MRKFLLLLVVIFVVPLCADAQKDVQKQLDKLTKQIAQKPDKEKYMERCYIYYNAQMYELAANDATSALNCILTTTPVDTTSMLESRFSRLACFKALGDTSLFNSELLVLEQSTDPRVELIIMHDLAQLFFDKSQYGKVVALCNKYIDDISFQEMRDWRIKANMKLGNYKQAMIDHVRQQVNEEKYDQNLINECVFKLQDQSDVIFDSLIMADSTNRRLYLARFNVEVSLWNNYRNSLKWLDKIFEIEYRPNLLVSRAMCYLELGMYARAFVDLIEAKQYNATTQVYQQFAMLYYRMGFTEKAINTLLDLDTNDDLYTSYFLGEFHYRLKDYDRAYQYFSNSIAIEPTAMALVRRGVINRMRGDEQAAIDDFQAILEMQPQDQPMSNTSLMPQALYYLGREAEAVEAVEQLIATWGARSQSVYGNGACIFSLTGDVKRAAECLNHAIDMGYSCLAEIDGDPELEALRQSDHYAPIRNRLAPLTYQ